MPRNSELNTFRKDAITSTVAELNKLDGFTGTYSDLNRLVGMTGGQVSNNSFVPSIKVTKATKTNGDYDLLASDFNTCVLCDSTAGSVILRPPTDAYNSAHQPLNGQVLLVVNIGSANAVELKPTSKVTGNVIYYGVGDNGTAFGGSGSLFVRAGGAALLLVNYTNFIYIGNGVYSTAS